jgi:hypothetical protein
MVYRVLLLSDDYTGVGKAWGDSIHYDPNRDTGVTKGGRATLSVQHKAGVWAVRWKSTLGFL